MADGKLVFFRPAANSGKLVFGDVGDAPSVAPAFLGIDAEFAHDQATPSLSLGVGRNFGIDAEFAHDAEAPALHLLWDANVSRVQRAALGSNWQQAQPVLAQSRAHWQRSEPIQTTLHTAYQQASPMHAAARLAWEATIALRTDSRQHWQQADPKRSAAQQRWEEALRLRTTTRQHWQEADPVRAAQQHLWQETLRLRSMARQHWQEAVPAHARAGVRWGPGTPVWERQEHHWQEARRPPPGVSARPPVIDKHVCYDPARLGLLVFEEKFTGDGKLVFVCVRKDDGPGPHPGQIIVPARKVYIVINDIDVRRVDGNISLPTMEATLAIDKDSWTWQMSATMHRAALPNLAPARFGEPVEIEFRVNGVPYRMMVESVQREWQHPTQRIVVRGRGKNAVLDAPYAPSLSFTNDSQRTAEQLMNDALTINGVPIGWSVDFGLVDWVVPAGAWMHQGSYISAIKAIAEAAGGYVQPHPTAQILRILPNYPVAPWDWGGIVPNIELPMNPVEVESVEWITKPNYNQVHLMGEVGGAFAEVYRGGTARDLAAEMVVDPLITHADVARQRGRAILSDTGHQAMVRWSLPVLPETGLIMPGQFVRREHEGEVFQGYVRSLNMNWDWPTLRQVIEVQAHG